MTFRREMYCLGNVFKLGNSGLWRINQKERWRVRVKQELRLEEEVPSTGSGELNLDWQEDEESRKMSAVIDVRNYL